MKIAVVIPCFRVKQQIKSVIEQIGDEVDAVYVVDDCCPEETGKFVQNECSEDARVKVVFHERNLGVGGATMTGYKTAAKDGYDICVKIDGDGQMDPSLIPLFTQPIVDGHADYTKGNRFFRLDSLSSMPRLRLFGNSVLSFVSKVSSGYWNIMDPTNGYTAIHTSVVSVLPLHKIDNRYFFESDMLFRLNVNRAKVMEVPMDAVYEEEESNLSISKALFEFPGKYFRRFLKRIFYNYVLRDFNVCSMQLLFGFLMVFGGVAFGIIQWVISVQTGEIRSTGTVMLSVLPTIVGFQLLLAAISYDISNVPKQALFPILDSIDSKAASKH